MPTPFYNTSPPTPNSKNTINSITVDFGIRDFLLNKNLAPVYPQISTSLNGSPKIGEPVLDTMVGTGNITQPFGLPLETEGILRWEIATIQNRYKNTSSTADSLISIDNITQTSGDFQNTTSPNGISPYPLDVDKYGINAKTVEANYRKNATIKNLYLDVDEQVDAADWITLEAIPTSQQIKGYLDVYGGLNLGGGAGIQAGDVIGSILNGQGLGLAKGGVVTNFDVRSSLAGRVLGSTGLINDTKLGIIGGQQLALALANNAAFNLQEDALGALNLQDNALSLINNGTLAGFRPNYQITVPSGTLGRVLDYTSRVLGFTLPKSFLDDSGSIFQSENGDSENVKRANQMLLNTGKGQVVALLKNSKANLAVNATDTAFRSGYAPAYTNNKGEVEITNGIIYAFGDGEGHLSNPLISSDGLIPDISYNVDNRLLKDGFASPSDNSIDSYAENTIKRRTFSWGSDVGGTVNSENSPFGGNIIEPFIGEKKNILSKTQKLFNSVGMKNIVSGFGEPNIIPTQTQTAVVAGGISKGSAVLFGRMFTEDGTYTGVEKEPVNTYCRSWTTLYRYDEIRKLIRKKGLNNDTYPYKTAGSSIGSVLDSNGFPKIAPYSSDKPDDPKKFMFSIENLAWSDESSNLLPCERGPGDLVTGKKGRIMWFPPYNIQFNENTSVNWETNNFIGRGEPIYTYNNTERSGTLSFQIIVDHPSYVNSFSKGSSGPDDHYVASFFAGCVDPTNIFADKLTVSELSDLSSRDVQKLQEEFDTEQPSPTDSPVEVYFPNDVTVFNSAYEDGKCGVIPIDYSENPLGIGPSCGIGTYKGTNGTGPWSDNHDYGLNVSSKYAKPLSINGTPYSGFSDPAFLPALNNFLNEKCPKCVVTVKGYASVQGDKSLNEQLALARATDIINTLKKNIHTGQKGLSDFDKRFIAIGGGELDSGEECVKESGAETDTIGCKRARKVDITFKYNVNLEPKTTAKPVIPQEEGSFNAKIKNRFYTECNYFEKLAETDSFVFDKFREKIKYFHPAFHSTTPEGLNSRLTFLQQCTRQGPTLEEHGGNNLAFGRAPVCILRVGDFYNTKIIVDNLSVDYEPLVWDLNPEGIGVQPMIANVNLTFKFIGGSALMGPINKLQNALSFNYYANTQVYDVRADYLSKDKPIVFKNNKRVNIETNPTGYYINNGFKGDMNKQVTVEVTQNEINNSVEINQEKDAGLS
jgi:hypothetical protein